MIIWSRTREKSGRGYAGSHVEQVSADSISPVVVVTHPDALTKI